VFCFNAVRLSEMEDINVKFMLHIYTHKRCLEAARVRFRDIYIVTPTLVGVRIHTNSLEKRV